MWYPSPTLSVNLPDAVAENIDSGPLWDETAFHGLGAATYGIDGASELRSSEVTPSLNQPLFIMTLAQLATSSPSELGRYLVDGVSPTQRHVIFASPGSPNQWATYSGTKFATLSALDTEPHVLGYQIQWRIRALRFYHVHRWIVTGGLHPRKQLTEHSFLLRSHHRKPPKGRKWPTLGRKHRAHLDLSGDSFGVDTGTHDSDTMVIHHSNRSKVGRYSIIPFSRPHAS